MVRKLIKFIRNVYYFRHCLFHYKIDDGDSILHFTYYILLDLRKSIHNCYLGENRNKKLEKIDRAIEILEHIKNDHYMKLYCDHKDYIPIKFVDGRMIRGSGKHTDNELTADTNALMRSLEIEQDEFNELMDILCGPRDIYKDYFDGSGLRGWWV